jgi:hypothetical protein
MRLDQASTPARSAWKRVAIGRDMTAGGYDALAKRRARCTLSALERGALDCPGQGGVTYAEKIVPGDAHRPVAAGA